MRWDEGNTCLFVCFFSPEFLKIGSSCVEACLHTPTWYKRTKNVFLCWIFPTVLLENSYGVKQFSLQGGLAGQPCSTASRSYCHVEVILRTSTLRAGCSTASKEQWQLSSLLPDNSASRAGLTAAIFSHQPQSSAYKAQQDLLPRATQLWL